MIDASNATLEMKRRPSGKFGMTIFRANLTLVSEVETDQPFADNPDLLQGFQGQLKDRLQQYLYGDLMVKIEEAQSISLQAAQATHTSMYEQVKSSFDEVIDQIRLHKVLFAEITDRS